jgi:hypothetical protein
MRKLETLGLAFLGAFALGTMARADGPAKGDSGDQADQSPSLEKERLESETAKKAVRKQSDRNKIEDKKSKEETAKREQDAAAIKREQAEYLRRLAVCDQLREIALKNNDENLNRQAEELQLQAWAVYSKRIAGISAGKDNGEKREGTFNIISQADISLPVDSQSVDADAKEGKP